MKSVKEEIQPDDRRKHKRFRVLHDTLLCSDHNMAEIIDISSGGIACKGLVGMADPLINLSEVELLNCVNGNAVQGLECRRVTRQVSELEIRNNLPVPPDCFFEFVGLTTYQAESLINFIDGCSKKVDQEIMFTWDVQRNFSPFQHIPLLPTEVDHFIKMTSESHHYPRKRRHCACGWIRSSRRLRKTVQFPGAPGLIQLLFEQHLQRT